MPSLSGAAAVLDSWLSKLLKPDAREWLSNQCDRAAAGSPGAPDPAFFVAFSSAARRCGRDDLAISADRLAAATAARSAWDPRRWTVDQAARTRLLLALPAPRPADLVAVLDRLAAAAEMGELVALYQALPLLPHPEAHRARAAEGVRSNIKAVFEAVALDNPYPAEALDEGAFNQLVLKALFVGSPLYRVVDLDRRANPRLTRTLIDFAHERLAAGRAVPAELWRPLAQCWDPAAFADAKRALETGDEAAQLAVALALSAAEHPDPRALAATRQDLIERIEARGIGWAQLAGG